MAQIDERKKLNRTFYPHRFDAAFESWLARHLPWVHRINQVVVNWLSRPHPGSTPRSAAVSMIVALILFAIFFVLVELLRY